MGDVVTGKYPVSFVQWRVDALRWSILDYLMTYPERTMLAITPQSPAVDMGLFIRPFRADSWNAILGMAFLMILTLTLSYLCNSNNESSDSVMIIITTSWYFFVLLNAFYGGALTMFFSTAIDLPFVTTREAMHAYPDWKLMMKQGFDTYFVVHAEQGDPDYAEFYDRILTQPEESVYKTTTEALNKMRNDRVVIHTTDRILSYHFITNSQQQSIEVFDRGFPEFKGPIVTKNSPLQPIMMPALIKSSERGSINRLLAMHQGPPLEAVKKRGT